MMQVLICDGLYVLSLVGAVLVLSDFHPPGRHQARPKPMPVRHRRMLK